MMRISVIVPCFDDGATLSETLRSLEGQEAHELVVVDDGSTDPETLAVLDELETEGTRIVHRPNGGLAAARMTGVEATSAPYVHPLDADDILGEGALARLADALDGRPDVAAAWGDVELFGTIALRPDVPVALDPWLLTFFNPVPGTCLIRRSALESVGGWRLAGGYEDWDLWLSFAERGYRGTYVPGTMLRYRQRSGRMNEDAIQRHETKYREVRALHDVLFAERRRLRRASPEPGHVKLLLPAIDSLPGLSRWRCLQLCRFVQDPRGQFASRRRREAGYRQPA
jgi:glycosyltransferase involved in cell wall biosynthesis